MRRAVAPLLLALAIVSALLAQSAARRDGANHEATSGPTTRAARLYVFGDSYSDIGAGYIESWERSCSRRSRRDRQRRGEVRGMAGPSRAICFYD